MNAINLERPDGSRAEVPVITLMTLRRGIKCEIETGMQLTRGPSSSARTKDILGLPKGLKKIDTFYTLNQLCVDIGMESVELKQA